MEDLSGSFNNSNGHGSSYARGQLRTHKIVLSGRKTCTITGVNDVLSFDINLYYTGEHGSAREFVR